jgi:hypothetical protein
LPKDAEDDKQPRYDMRQLEDLYLSDEERNYYQTSGYSFPISVGTHAEIFSCSEDTPTIYIPRHRDTDQFQRILNASKLTRYFGSKKIGQYYGKQPWMTFKIETVSGGGEDDSVFRLHGDITASEHIAELYDIYATARERIATEYGDRGRVRFVIETPKQPSPGFDDEPSYWIEIKAEIVEDC